MFEKICIVCYANYCRSPVAEAILNHTFRNKTFTSAGINPLSTIGMDKRSLNYLNLHNYKIKQHIPKKINSNIVNSNDLVLAIDFEILLKLNNMFPSAKNKIKLFTFQNPEIKLRDPYKLEKDEYFECMEKIEIISKELIL